MQLGHIVELAAVEPDVEAPERAGVGPAGVRADGGFDQASRGHRRSADRGLYGDDPGGRRLFEGLAIHNRWDWSVRHPVLRLSFGSGNFKEPGYLHINLMAQLDVLEEQLGVGARYDTAAERFGHLVRMSSVRAGQRAVILVDEYDKPILDALDAPEVARANRDFLRGLYAVVKDCDAHIRFSFITGVSKFSKVSLFSGLNNLTDITLEPDYSAICGYTDADLDTVFAPELGGLDRDQVRDWYNGYSWRGDEKVYNPFDILLLFRKREFAAHCGLFAGGGEILR